MPLPTYKVICAWCQQLIAEKPATDDHLIDAVSHSICESCKKKIEEENDL